MALWAQRYQSISEMDDEDRPGQEVIEEDAMLDKYLDDLTRRRQMERQRLRRGK